MFSGGGEFPGCPSLGCVPELEIAVFYNVLLQLFT